MINKEVDSILEHLGTIINTLDTLPSIFFVDKVLYLVLKCTSKEQRDSIISAMNESNFMSKIHRQGDNPVEEKGYIIKIIYTPFSPRQGENLSFPPSSTKESTKNKVSVDNEGKNQDSTSVENLVAIGQKGETSTQSSTKLVMGPDNLARRKREIKPPDGIKIPDPSQPTVLPPICAPCPDSARKSGPKKLIPEDSFAYILAEGLYNLISARKDTFKKPNLQEWARNVDLMIRLDNRDPETIGEVIEWCQLDTFWQNNILSTKKLRIQYDQLELKMNSQRKLQRSPKETVSKRVWEVTEEIYTKYREEVSKEFSTNILNNFVKDQIKFVECAEKVITFSSSKHLVVTNTIDILFECLKSCYGKTNSPIFPTHLCSENTWKIILPQFIKERYNL